jgi:hypothetical protein
LATSAQAAAPEDAYFAARDPAVARVKKLDSEKMKPADFSAALNKETEALAALLRPLIGPVDVKGFSGQGRLNMDGEGESEAGFGPLDGLTFTPANPKDQLVVTTEPIFRRWLADHKELWADGEPKAPPNAAALLASEDFYTHAFETDAAFVLYGALPVATPKGLAVAMLAAQTQDEYPSSPNEIVAAVIANGRVLMANTPTRAKFAPAAACSKARNAAQDKIAAADPPTGAMAAKWRADSESAFRSCFQARLKTQKAFAEATIQAQALVDAMAGK